MKVDATVEEDRFACASDRGNGSGGTWDGRCHDPSLAMFREAVNYAQSRGLTPDFMPELRSENGVLHAFLPSGGKLRLEASPGWEHRTGYAALVEQLVAVMRARQREA